MNNACVCVCVCVCVHVYIMFLSAMGEGQGGGCLILDVGLPKVMCTLWKNMYQDVWRTLALLVLFLFSWNPAHSKVVSYLSGLAGRKELVLATLKGKVQGVCVHFSHHNSPNSRALARQPERENCGAAMIQEQGHSDQN